MFKIALFLILSLGAFANDLSIIKGEIKAHTEVFGDSEINPQTTNLKSLLTINDKVESIKGEIFFDTLSLVSSKKDRDENMYKLLSSEVHKVISFSIKNIVKNETNYDINGVLSLNGIKKEITVPVITKIPRDRALMLDFDLAASSIYNLGINSFDQPTDYNRIPIIIE